MIKKLYATDAYSFDPIFFPFAGIIQIRL